MPLPKVRWPRPSAAGNPTALVDLEPGQDVLDLGSGGGLDVLLSARRVAPDGVAYGLDMTDEMLALAERNRAEAGIAKRAVREGHDRGRSAARRQRRCGHLQLRDQPVHRQGPGARRGLPRPASRWPVRGLRHRAASTAAGGVGVGGRPVDRLQSPGPCWTRTTSRSWPRPGSATRRFRSRVPTPMTTSSRWRAGWSRSRTMPGPEEAIAVLRGAFASAFIRADKAAR